MSALVLAAHAEERAGRGVADDDALTMPATMSAIVALYQRSATGIRLHFAALAAIEDEVSAVIGLAEKFRQVRISASHCHHTCEFRDVDYALAKLRREFWRCIAERLELHRVMSIKDAEALDAFLDKGPFPDITEESVRAFGEKYSDLGGVFSRAVAEVFDWLRPRSRVKGTAGQFKTNDLVVIGAEVHLHHVLDFDAFGKMRVHAYDRDKFSALERVFLVLAGEGQRTRTYNSEIVDAIGRQSEGETAFFAYRGFKNRNLRLRFKRPDLVAKLNAVAGGMNLRSARSM